MIAACILVLSAGATVQFALAYCRTLLLAYSKVELSPWRCGWQRFRANHASLTNSIA